MRTVEILDDRIKVEYVVSVNGDDESKFQKSSLGLWTFWEILWISLLFSGFLFCTFFYVIIISLPNRQ